MPLLPDNPWTVQCGTYDRQARTGGCNGSFRFEFNE